MKFTRFEILFMIDELEKDREVYETTMKLRLASKAEIALYQTKLDLINGLLAKLRVSDEN